MFKTLTNNRLLSIMCLENRLIPFMYKIGCTRAQCIYVQDSNVFVVNCSLDQNDIFLLISSEYFHFEFYFVKYQAMEGTCFLILFDCSTIVHSLTLRQCLSLILRCVSCRNHKWILFFIPFRKPVPFDCRMKPLIFKLFIEKYLLVVVNMLVLVCAFYFVHVCSQFY